jgi:hypothetical protein
MHQLTRVDTWIEYDPEKVEAIGGNEVAKELTLQVELVRLSGVVGEDLEG